MDQTPCVGGSFSTASADISLLGYLHRKFSTCGLTLVQEEGESLGDKAKHLAQVGALQPPQAGSGCQWVPECLRPLACHPACMVPNWQITALRVGSGIPCTGTRQCRQTLKHLVTLRECLPACSCAWAGGRRRVLNKGDNNCTSNSEWQCNAPCLSAGGSRSYWGRSATHEGGGGRYCMSTLASCRRG